MHECNFHKSVRDESFGIESDHLSALADVSRVWVWIEFGWLHSNATFDASWGISQIWFEMFFLERVLIRLLIQIEIFLERENLPELSNVWKLRLLIPHERKICDWDSPKLKADSIEEQKLWRDKFPLIYIRFCFFKKSFVEQSFVRVENDFPENHNRVGRVETRAHFHVVIKRCVKSKLQTSFSNEPREIRITALQRYEASNKISNQIVASNHCSINQSEFT